jgi:hypothetical protein
LSCFKSWCVTLTVTETGFVTVTVSSLTGHFHGSSVVPVITNYLDLMVENETEWEIPFSSHSTVY